MIPDPTDDSLMEDALFLAEHNVRGIERIAARLGVTFHRLEGLARRRGFTEKLLVAPEPECPFNERTERRRRERAMQ